MDLQRNSSLDRSTGDNTSYIGKKGVLSRTKNPQLMQHNTLIHQTNLECLLESFLYHLTNVYPFTKIYT